ncbi:BA75_02315T3 [Komagataella pastoris]|nr:BA75_02315T2 [Komagataella pastoris]ANZ75222.1 BA75_02315T4 [Komagataella pastoris]ANZ75223.1 BA75_02315T1 [Komagataella pastoris]ANZ75225.1 BA75_02315T3 [Komagataella pastoris]
MVNDYRNSMNTGRLSRLKQLVPNVGLFFTKLPLEKAFYIEDERRSISKRRLVAPSFNDIRVILNTAQILELGTNFHSSSTDDRLKLVTFDGDVTLYEDGHSMEKDSLIIPEIIQLLKKGLYIGIVTAAGYSNPSGDKYYARLKGLVDCVNESEELNDEQKSNILVMGGEANFLFRLQGNRLLFINPKDWILNEMSTWDPQSILETLDFGAKILTDLKIKLGLPALVIRKERGVGLVPEPGVELHREQLEEVVLTCDYKLREFPPACRITYCAFNGGSDVWIDIGDKSLGVKVLQKFLSTKECNVRPHNTLHVGDQFAAIGANDYRARLSGSTCWIANPEETKNCLKDLNVYIDQWATI